MPTASTRKVGQTVSPGSDRDVVAFLGTSRMELAYDAEAFADAGPKLRGVQLSIDGVSAFAPLADVAAMTVYRRYYPPAEPRIGKLPIYAPSEAHSTACRAGRSSSAGGSRSSSRTSPAAPCGVHSRQPSPVRSKP